jgi:hypothetical protein
MPDSPTTPDAFEEPLPQAAIAGSQAHPDTTEASQPAGAAEGCTTSPRGSVFVDQLSAGVRTRSRNAV